MFRRITISVVVVLLAVFAATPAFTPAAAEDRAFPAVIPLPDGFQPEGIAVGPGTTFYVGSIPTGAIFSGRLRSGEGDILVEPQEGRSAIGLDFDERSGYLFVSGGPTGQGYVYDARSGDSLTEFTFTTAENTFINDVIVTSEAAYFTNSMQPFIYRVPLESGGGLPDEDDFEAIELGGDFEQVEGFNTNGIASTPDGRWLIIVNSKTGNLYRVNPHSGNARLIDLDGGSVPFGDGLLLDGRTLYVVQNQLNQIAKIKLDSDFNDGEIVEIITDDDFRVPTTIADLGDFLYVVNARFDTEPTPDTEYEVVKVRK